LESIEGDIEEDFHTRVDAIGRKKAKLYYHLDVLRFFKPFAVRNPLNSLNINPMFKINTVIAFRNLFKHKLYSFINISGLSIGIAAVLIISHYVLFQLSYDDFQSKGDRLFRVHRQITQAGEDFGTSAFTAFALGTTMAADVPEFEEVARVHPFYGGAIVSHVVDSVSSGAFRETDLLFTDPSILNMLSFEFVQGNPSTALDGINSVIITESTLEKYFGNRNQPVIGEQLDINGGWGSGYAQITGVVKDFPANSHFNFDFLLPLEKTLQDEQYTSEGADWGWNNFYTYVTLIPQSNEGGVEAKIADLKHQYRGEELDGDDRIEKLLLQQVSDIHLRSEVSGADDMVANPGDIKTVYFMIIIASFILVIAWINFINLSTAKATERGLEVGIKKAIGAQKNQLMIQFLTESFWVNFIALSIAVGLTFLLMPYLSELIGENLMTDFTHPVILTTLLLLLFVGPLLAGLYPSVVLSSFRTVTALKGKFVSKNSHTFNLRRGLVVFQFVISSLLIAGTFAVSKQLKFMQNEDTGMSLSQILTVRGPELNVTRTGFEAFKNNLSQNASVESFSSSRSVPGAGYNWGTRARRMGASDTDNQRISVTWIDESFFDTFDMDLVAGRGFDFSQERDDDQGMIINEASLLTFGLGTAEEALTQKIILSGDTMNVRAVIKNHHWSSLHTDYSPVAFLYRWASVDYFSLKVNQANIEQTIRDVENEYAEAFPGNPVEYYFLDDFFNRQYKADIAFANVFKVFSVFAIIAACMGLFGLASFSVVQKAKEIGIRRVLGATSMEITILFSRRYLILMIIANLIAIPIAYFGIEDWLEGFAFSINISADLFIIPLIILLAISLLTVSFQTLRASLANPVKNLRSE